MFKFKTLLVQAIMLTSTLFGLSAQTVKNLSAAEFKKTIDSGKYLIIDVRIPEEFALGHILDAVNINVADSDFSKKVQAKTQKQKQIAIYCRSGRRSKLAINQIESLKLQIVELNDGIISWQQAGYSLTTAKK